MSRTTGILVIGNGPSTVGIDFTKLKDMDTIGMNSAYRYWDKHNWYPTFYVCLDNEVIMSHSSNIVRLVNEKKIKFFFLRDEILQRYPGLKKHQNIIWLSDVRDKFKIFSVKSITTGSWSIRLALYLGYKRIYMIGIDCKYTNIINGATRVNNNDKSIALVIKTEIKKNANYFFDDYQQKGDKYNIPNAGKDTHKLCMLKLYKNFQQYYPFGIKNVKIYNMSNISQNLPFEKFALAEFKTKHLVVTEVANVAEPEAKENSQTVVSANL